MDALMNIKSSLTLLGGGAFLFLTSALACNVLWLTAALMIVGITAMAIGGAFFIRNTWISNDAKRDERQWGRCDFAKWR